MSDLYKVAEKGHEIAPRTSFCTQRLRASNSSEQSSFSKVAQFKSLEASDRHFSWGGSGLALSFTFFSVTGINLYNRSLIAKFAVL